MKNDFEQNNKIENNHELNNPDKINTSNNEDLKVEGRRISNILNKNSQKENDTIVIINDEKDLKKSLRMGFIKKVYSILFIQLAITSSIMIIGLIDKVSDYYLITSWPFYVALAINIVSCLVLTCFKRISKRVPYNYILLFLVTVCQGIILSYIIAIVNDWKLVLTSSLITLVVVLSLTVYAFTTKTDFTYLGGTLFLLVALLLCLGIFSVFVGGFLKTLYCVLGVAVFGVYLIFDTQLILGRFGKEYSIDDYIVAALSIYIDIVNIFVYILSLFSR